MVEYKGVCVEQLPAGPQIVLFSAPVAEIALWSGIPQRRRLAAGPGSIETAGFQREEKARRVADIAAFMHNPDNVIQNPLLAATQDPDHVTIVEEGGGCVIKILPPDLAQLTMRGLLERAVRGLEERIPELSVRTPSADALAHIRDMMEIESPEPISETGDQVDDAVNADDPAIAMEIGLFEEETQVVDFYDELRARADILRELGDDANDLDEVAGFTREFLESLVKPVVLVDGQHRLRGALLAIDESARSEEGMARIAEFVDSGLGPEEAAHQYALEVGRRLPVSLLVSSDPAEHVFQFVVVNQKATPMSNALLGTIVSTSLSQDELEPIRQRLKSAGIELESSRAIAYLTRAPESPFRGLVSTGVTGDRPNSLPWSVLGKLINIVRLLEGGVPFHPPAVDYARLWRNGDFQSSGLVDSSLTGPERLSAWSAVDGPWRGFFIKLHTRIRDKFGNPDDMAAHNAWGSTRSNLFNMVSLSILTSDFFRFLHSNHEPIADFSDMDRVLDDWLDGLSGSYFDRDWRMGGTKKDQPRVKSAWSAAWQEYRETRERLPRVEKYNPGGGG